MLNAHEGSVVYIGVLVDCGGTLTLPHITIDYYYYISGGHFMISVLFSIICLLLYFILLLFNHLFHLISECFYMYFD